MRTQVAQARRRQYPDSANVVAKWLAYIAARLKATERQLGDLPPPGAADRDMLAEDTLVEILACYEELEILEKADTSQVADYVVTALKRSFVRADADCDYLFACGTRFELSVLTSEIPDDDPDVVDALNELKSVVYGVTMPGGALGAGFHIPLVSHELGHVLLLRLQRQHDEAGFAYLLETFGDEKSDKAFLNWVFEVLADTICCFVMGPAAFFSLHEKLRGGGGAPDLGYPDNAVRVASLAALVKAEYGHVIEANGIRPEGWNNWPVETDEQLLRRTDSYDDGSDGGVNFAQLSRRLIERLPEIRIAGMRIAEHHIKDLQYPAEQYAEDLRLHLENLRNVIPPFETPGELTTRRPTDLATIMNVGWFLAAFCPATLRVRNAGESGRHGQLLTVLDELILKAIELSEIQRLWVSQ
jgi:hypothetical protein